MVNWSSGQFVKWSIGQVVNSSKYQLVKWSIRQMVNWSIDTNWSSGRVDIQTESPASTFVGALFTGPSCAAWKSLWSRGGAFTFTGVHDLFSCFLSPLRVLFPLSDRRRDLYSAPSRDLTM
jgi:hypothetical protein